LILIVQFPRGLRNFIYSPEKPVVVVFPFPSILVHGECNSTFLTSFNLFSRIIWFTHFVRADSALAFVGQNHSQSHLFHLVFVYRPSPLENSFTYSSKHQLLSPILAFPLFMFVPKRKENLVGRRLKNSPRFLHFSATQLTSPPNCKFWYCIKKPSGIPTSRILSR